MKWFTEVNPPETNFNLSYDQSFFFLGSCFSEHLFNELKTLQFKSFFSPFGILYNPDSIAEALHRISLNRTFINNEILEKDGLWYSYSHHSQFTSKNPSDFLKSINKELNDAHIHFKNCQTLTITFGTQYAFQLKSSQKKVSNCHKQNSNLFERVLLDADEIYEKYLSLLKTIFKSKPKLKIILTVSPIRHLRDKPEENSLSKGMLRTLCHRVQQKYPDNIYYFPAYEIMIDELRDYRFYETDLIHPTKLAIQHILSKFLSVILDERSKQYLQEIKRIYKSIQHRPLNGNQETWEQFINNELELLHKIQEKHPCINLDEFRKQLLLKLNHV